MGKIPKINNRRAYVYSWISDPWINVGPTIHGLLQTIHGLLQTLVYVTTQGGIKENLQIMTLTRVSRVDKTTTMNSFLQHKVSTLNACKSNDGHCSLDSGIRSLVGSYTFFLHILIHIVSFHASILANSTFKLQGLRNRFKSRGQTVINFSKLGQLLQTFRNLWM